jgi:hypothetical protein
LARSRGEGEGANGDPWMLDVASAERASVGVANCKVRSRSHEVVHSVGVPGAARVGERLC